MGTMYVYVCDQYGPLRRFIFSGYLPVKPGGFGDKECCHFPNVFFFSRDDLKKFDIIQFSTLHVIVRMIPALYSS